MKTLKEKYNSIDQSKISAEQKSFLEKIKKVTSDFTSKDKEVNDKVEGALDKMIATFKEKMPEAIKETSTKTKKRSVMSVAKDIRKDGESFTEAKKRATKKIADDKESAKETIKSELDKLNEFIKSRKSLAGLKGTDLLRDSKRKAKPIGKRVSKTGKVYYEYRDSKTDRLSPSYPKNAPYLADGGKLGEKVYFLKESHNKHTPDIWEEATILNYSENEIKEAWSYKDWSKENIKDYVAIKIGGKDGFEKLIKKSELKKKFAVGGAVVQDLAGHNGGHFGAGNHGLLDGFSGTHYDGLVGETGAMSSGELFMDGGSVAMANQQVIDDASQGYVNYYLTEGASAGMFKDGGAIENQYAGKTPEQIWNMLSISQRYHFLHDHKKEIESTPASVEKATKTAYKFLPEKIKTSFKKHIEMGQYARGGSVKNERKHVNKEEDYEVRYAKQRPSRKGYLGKRDFAHGGGLGYSKKERLIDYYYNNEVFDDYETYELSEKDLDNKNKVVKAIIKYHGLNNPKIVDEKFNDLLGDTEFAKGGGVRRVGNREYSTGRNWTNDHKHVNKSEEHEVKYTRKGKFLGIFADGGEFMTDPNFGNFQNNIYAGGGRVESLTKELNRLQRELNSSRLQTYRLGDNSQEAIDRKNEREVKLARFNEVLKELRELDAKYAGGGMVGKEISFVRHGEAGKGIIGEVNEDGSFAVATGNSIKLVEPDDVIEIHDAPKRRSFFFAGGGGIEDETPKIYVADLEAYNNGKLSGVWLDLTDYNDADELMDAIQDFLKTSGGEEYAIHDYENLPSSMYSEYMGKSDFEEIYQMIDLAKNNNLPLEVVMEVVSQYDESALDEYYGVYDDEEDFAYQQVEEVGLENFSSPEYYVYISETDRRLLSQEMADSYVDDIKDEDGGKRLIEEAGLDVDEYDEADSDRQEEMLDEARELVYDEYYDSWYMGLSDPYYYLVEEIGLYSPEDFFKASFVQVDYEKLARDLEQDYTFVNHDGQLYVFNIR